MRRRRMEVTVETEVRVSMRGHASEAGQTCWCGGLLLPPLAAAQAASISVRAVYRLIEAMSVHFTHEPEPRVCSRSVIGIAGE
ncbi:MAG: hypothetical protein M3Q69_14185 [Acidobacteriota bacterium]|nr:hypothetical protein [Acidobacteriota bacterium]